MGINSDAVVSRTIAHSDQPFHQKHGKPFTYSARGRTIELHTTNRLISRAAIEQALDRVPLGGPGEVQDLSGPSYIWGILMDSRIRESDW